jgi:hypothetical protein
MEMSGQPQATACLKYAFDKRLGGAKSRSGRRVEEKYFARPGIESGSFSE